MAEAGVIAGKGFGTSPAIACYLLLDRLATSQFSNPGTQCPVEFGQE
jgi:hypothetical protein